MSWPNRYIDRTKFLFLLSTTTVVVVGYLFLQKKAVDDPGVLYAGGSLDEIRWIENSDPVEEAKRSFAEGNLEVLQIYASPNPKEVKWVVPGDLTVPEKTLNSVFRRRSLQCTDNWGMTAEQRALAGKAVAFAEKFNETMLECWRNENIQ